MFKQGKFVISEPELQECDIVMEGGITSGVVYPRFIAGMAQRFRLRSIGGASVGAVAAVAAAASEYRRATSSNRRDISGFVDLGKVPNWLSSPGPDGKSHLFSLFQPCSALRRHFAVLQAALNRDKAARISMLLMATLYRFPPGIFIALAIVAGLADWRSLVNVPRNTDGLAPWLGAWACVLLALAGLAILLCILHFGWTALRGLRANRLGICSGMSVPGNSGPALTEWLHGLVQASAGLPSNRPLTFRDLAGVSPPIELAFMTTGLSELRAHRFPSASKGLLFRRSELLPLFPQEVVDALVAHAYLQHSATSAAKLRLYDAGAGTVAQDLYRLPLPEHLPVLFGARVSLSFPLLLQAVPLYRYRYMAGNGVDAGRLDLKRVWLTDGGLTSNFPIHFFDSLLPERPTFGIALDGTLAEGAPPSARVVVARRNGEGLAARYNEVDDSHGRPDFFAFISAIIRTIRCWRDEALRRSPGYRDRIVHVRHTSQEGGLNLNMPEKAIRAMGDSGADAAAMLIRMFGQTDGRANSWLNHRVVRMRSTTAMLQQTLKAVSVQWNRSTHQPSYRQLWSGSVKGMPRAYPLTEQQRNEGIDFWTAVQQAAPAAAADLSGGAPRPRPTLEVTPPQS